MTAGAVLVESGRLLVRRPWLVLVVAAVVVPLDVLERVTSTWFFGVASFLADPIAGGAVTALALSLLAGRQANTAAAFGVALRRAPILVAATIVSSLGIGLGLVLLVIPGLVLEARWSVFVPVLINERVVGMGLGRSWKLVLGHSWVALWATLVPAFVGVAASVMTFFFSSSSWRAVSIAAHPVLLTYEAMVAVVLCRWLVASPVTQDAVLGPELDPHSSAYDTRGELGP